MHYAVCSTKKYVFPSIHMPSIPSLCCFGDRSHQDDDDMPTTMLQQWHERMQLCDVRMMDVFVLYIALKESPIKHFALSGAKGSFDDLSAEWQTRGGWLKGVDYMLMFAVRFCYPDAYAEPKENDAEQFLQTLHWRREI
jgi:hypothetical protein